MSNHSERRLFTGFTLAALTVCRPMVANAMMNAMIPAPRNTHQLKSMRDAKSSSHLCIKNHDTGRATTAEKITSFMKYLDHSTTICGTLAPNTFLTPISLTRCDMVNADNPNKPKHAINIARQENMVNSLLSCCSASYNF